MDRPDSRSLWNANAAAWTELSRAGFDVYRDLVNTPAFFALLPPIAGLRCLDLGCGEGHNTRLLADQGADVVALDIADVFIAAAATQPRRGIRYVLGDGATLPFRAASFDVVTAFMSLMDVGDPERTLRKMARVLRPGGFAQFSVVHPTSSTRIRRWVDDEQGRRQAVEVPAGQRRHGVGTALLDAVRERRRPDGRPLRGKVFARSPAAEFAATRGFKIIQRSRTFRLDSGESTTAGELVVEAPAPPSVTAAAFRDFYIASHSWDPAGPITLDDITEVHLADAAVPIVVRAAAGEPLAAGFLYDEDGVLSLSGGPTDPADSRAEAASAALLDSVPKPVLVEADDSVPAMVAALSARGATVVDEVHLVAEA